MEKNEGYVQEVTEKIPDGIRQAKDRNGAGMLTERKLGLLWSVALLRPMGNVRIHFRQEPRKADAKQERRVGEEEK